MATVRGQAEDVQMAEVSLHQTITAQPRLETLTTLTVPSGACGRIIGRQGDTIRDIQRISGCRMDVARDPIRTIKKVLCAMLTNQNTCFKKQIDVGKELLQLKVR